MSPRARWLQVAILAAGSLFAWTTVVGDYRRFFAAGGGVFQFTGCASPNPLATPCFYGAIAFVAALWWAARLPRLEPARQAASQRRLTWFLAAGTAFAWANVAREAWRLARHAAPQAFGCAAPAASADRGVAAVFGTPCFAGASIFLAALLVALALRGGPARPDG